MVQQKWQSILRVPLNRDPQAQSTTALASADHVHFFTDRKGAQQAAPAAFATLANKVRRREGRNRSLSAFSSVVSAGWPPVLWKPSVSLERHRQCASMVCGCSSRCSTATRTSEAWCMCMCGLGSIFFVDASTAPSTFFATARAQSCDFSDSRHFHRYLVGHNASTCNGSEDGGPR